MIIRSCQSHEIEKPGSPSRTRLDFSTTKRQLTRSRRVFWRSGWNHSECCLRKESENQVRHQSYNVMQLAVAVFSAELMVVLRITLLVNITLFAAALVVACAKSSAPRQNAGNSQLVATGLMEPANRGPDTRQNASKGAAEAVNKDAPANKGVPDALQANQKKKSKDKSTAAQTTVPGPKTATTAKVNTPANQNAEAERKHVGERKRKTGLRKLSVEVLQRSRLSKLLSGGVALDKGLDKKKSKVKKTAGDAKPHGKTPSRSAERFPTYPEESDTLKGVQSIGNEEAQQEELKIMPTMPSEEPCPVE
ncbi:hypothetical protein Y032_0363g3527 [Ancylostoma ceylanicum]|uniref:Uncharacterized protein n=1 Tax=Ancylostoma ceylanicum TaxID=53326 RepID=A0A016RVX2_9BILA|nr:hypothetical protein Y032_0363g3527 [Ancylostoma ceylanicum]